MFSFSLVTPGDDDHSFKAAILSFDNEIKILADPSWNGKDVNSSLFMEQHLREVQVILLSHSTPEFLSGYVLLCIKFPNLMATIPVYSTLPVNQLGRISTVEYYRANGILGPLNSAIMELDDVDEWFDKIVLIKFLQTTNLFDNKIILTPYNAGHTLGGTFWLITKRIDKIIYAPAWNHSKDSFLNSATFLSTTTGNPLSQLLRPTALITSSDLGSTMSHKKRTEKFLQLVDATLSNGGAVLIPTSLSGRFLEVFRLVDDHLQGAPIPVYFLSYSGTKVLSYASNLLDWMAPNIIKDWEDFSSDNSHKGLPFDPSKVDLLMEPNELVQLSGPKIVFCSGLDLRNGDLSTQAFQNLCQDEKTTILLTEKSSFGVEEMLTSQLYNEWYDLTKKKTGGKVEDGVAVPFERMIPLDNWIREEELSGVELNDFKERIALERQEKLLAKVRDRKNQNLLNADPIDGDDSSDEDISSDEETRRESLKPEVKGPTLPVEELTSHEAFLTDHIKQSLEQNKPLDLKITYKLKPRQAMFPYFINSHKQKFDDYGEVIDVKDFQKTDETNNSQIILEGKKKFEQNEKRKWGDEDKYKKGDRGSKRQNKQSKLTPQEILNNQLLQRNLDTLYSPKKRVPYQSGSSFSTQPLRVRCGLSFVDLSGLVDLRSLSIIVSALKPYNLFLLPDFTVKDQQDKELSGVIAIQSMFAQQQDNQEKEETKKKLYSSSKYMSLSNIRSGMSNMLSYGNNTKMNVLPIELNTKVKIGGDSDAGSIGLSNFEVKLDDSIIENLNWQNIDGSYRVAQVYGELELHNPSLDKTNKSKDLNDYISPSTLFTLKKVKKEDYLKYQEKNQPTQPVKTTGSKLAIGNIRLPELKKKLLNRNLNAEFKSEGTLVVNDMLAIRKVAYSSIEGDDTGDIVIDGNMGPLYYEVKDCIREMLAYV